MIGVWNFSTMQFLAKVLYNSILYLVCFSIGWFLFMTETCGNNMIFFYNLWIISFLFELLQSYSRVLAILYYVRRKYGVLYLFHRGGTLEPAFCFFVPCLVYDLTSYGFVYAFLGLCCFVFLKKSLFLLQTRWVCIILNLQFRMFYDFAVYSWIHVW